jgi:hypothetical protein
MAVNRHGRFWWCPLCWASLAAVICAYLFFWSTFPVTIPDEPPGLGRVSDIGFFAELVYLINALSSLPLFLSGFFRLRRRRRLTIAWVCRIPDRWSHHGAHRDQRRADTQPTSCGQPQSKAVTAPS